MPGAFDKRASVVRSGPPTTSAKATYAASYAVRFARLDQIPRQHRPVSMAPEIELVEPPDGRLGTVRSHGPRLDVAP